MSAGRAPGAGQRSEEDAGSLEDQVEAQLETIRTDSRGVNAVITVTPELARADAARVLAARRRGTPLPLDGMTVVVKDNIDMGGVRSTRGSAWFCDRVAHTDATVVRRLHSAGAIILGTAGLHEFAFGATSNNPHFGPIRNPWNLERIPGGSSGGSAAAVAAGWVTGALGTDTGGSVRCPAALCGVTGLRPTFGVISNHGVYPIGPSFDTVGPMARHAADVARLFTAICGQDRLDPDSVAYLGTPYISPAVGARCQLRIGVPSNSFFETTGDVAQSVRAAIQQFESLGASVQEIDIPAAARAYELAVLIVRAEALSIHHDRLEDHPERFGEDVARRLHLASHLQGWEVAALYRQLISMRHEIRQVFAEVDVVATPTVPHPAPPIETSEMIATTASVTRFTYPWSVAGAPSLSVPCGFSAERLPIGLQLIGPPHSDMQLCSIGAAYQEVTDWHLHLPPVALMPM